MKEDDLKWWSRDFVRAYKAQTAGIDAGVCLPLGELARSIKCMDESFFLLGDIGDRELMLFLLLGLGDVPRKQD